MKKKPLTILMLLLLFSTVGWGQTTLSPGDILIVTVNSDGSDNFDFVPLVNIATGTIISFTDNAWTGTVLNSNEGTILFTAGTDISAGILKSYSGIVGGEWSKSGSFAIATSGDNLLAYQGSSSSPNFIYGIGWAIASPWISSGSVSTNNSYIPNNLSEGSKTLVTLGSLDNYQYNATNGTSGTKTELLALISVSSNWNVNDVSAFAALSTNFTINTGSSSVSLSSASSLTESNLNGAELTLALTSETFVASPVTSDFTLNNAPTGTSISGITRNSDTGATLTLAFNGTDFDSDIANFNVTAGAAALTGGNPLTSNSISIDAFTAPSATTNVATSTFDESAKLNGTVSSNGYATTVTFEYGISDSYGSTVTATQSPLASGAASSAVSATISGLTNDQLYHYRVKAVNTEGPTYGSDQTFTPVAGINAWINEIHYDNASTDENEVIEVIVENSGSINLSDIQIDLYNGSGGATYDTESLNIFMEGTTDGNFTIYFDSTTWGSGIQNGPDGISLSYKGNLIQFLSYGGSFTATNGHAIEQVSTNIGVSETTSTPVGYSLQLTGGGLKYSDFTWASPNTATAGALNNVQVLGTKWTGATNNGWSTVGNWNNGVPSSSLNALIPSSGITNFPTVESADNANVLDLVLDHSAQINGQENLTVNGTTTIYHQITESTSASALNHWQYFTPPFTGLTSGNLLCANTRVDLYLAGYNNALSATLNDAWSFVSSATAPLSPGTGYAVTFVDDGTETGTDVGTDYNMKLSGTLINASANASVSLTQGLNNWNLIGNPYLVPINWFDINLNLTNIQGSAAYVYNPATSSYITISSNGSGSGTISSGSSALIPPLQGFFVEASSAGSFEIDLDARVNTAQSFYKSETISPLLRVQVQCDSLFDESVLILNEMAEQGFDAMDAHKLLTNGLSPQIYTSTPDGHHLVFNQTNSLDNNIVLQVQTQKAKEYTIRLNEISGDFNNYRIYLTGQNNLNTELTDTEFSFNAAEGTNTYLFQLSFQNKTSNLIFDWQKTKVYAFDKDIMVQSTDELNGEINIFNLSGQKICHSTLNGKKTVINLQNETGIMLVQLINNGQMTHHKVTIR